jgi:hypothetical protein
MIGHQHIGDKFNAVCFTTVGQSIQKNFTVFVGDKYILATIAAVHHMVIRTRIFYSQWSGHWALLANYSQVVKLKDLTLFLNVDIEAFKKTSLNLKLWGTITGKNVRAYAIIEETTNRKQKLYREGDVIQNAVVKRILRGKVILSIDDNFEILDIEIKRADVNAKNKYGVTALIDASFRGQKEVVELLIVEGADLDAQDNKGDTALMNAAIKGHREIAELLVTNGADVDIQDNSGNTALIDSAKYARESTCDVIGLLIDNGADVNAGNKYGATALMNAAQWGHLENVDCLIAEGAGINVKSKSGETAMKLAELSNHEAVVELLKKHGGNAK